MRVNGSGRRGFAFAAVLSVMGMGLGVGVVSAATARLVQRPTIAAGDGHSLLLKTDGTLWTFGYNDYGQLGTTTNNGTAVANPTPTQVMTGVTAIAAGSNHSLALKTNGTLWSFGYNYYGQLGTTTNNGTGTASPTPTQVMTNVTAIAASGTNSLALKTDATLWSFGSNYYGQLGTTTNNGTGTGNPTPTQVMTGVTAIAAGTSHSLALRTDGTLWTFGYNYFGQLGTTTNNGIATANPTPTQVMTNVTAIAAGTSHSLALKTDGTLWTFGSNYYGQLGTTTNNGTTAAANPTPTQVMTGVAASPFVSLVPARLMDTRPGTTTIDGLLGGIGTRASGSITEVPIATRGGVPVDAAAVVLNVTAVNTQGDGYATVYPCSAAIPTASNLNFGAGATIANAVIIQIGNGGKVCVYTDAVTDLLVDVNGFYPAGSSFSPMVPARLMDTRPGAPTVDGQQAGIGLRANASITQVPVAGRAGVPLNATSVALNVTVTGTQQAGYATVYPCGGTVPTASNLNYGIGTTIANAVITKLGVGGNVCVYTDGATHLIVDINGYYPTYTSFFSMTPARVMDTRPGASTIDGQQAGIGLRPSGSITEVIVGGRAGVPVGAASVVLNVTVTGTQQAGYATVYPCGGTVPTASNLNYGIGTTIANAVITKLGPGGKVCVFTDGATHVLVDINGYYPN